MALFGEAHTNRQACDVFRSLVTQQPIHRHI
jgi:hypothetical protein